MHQTRNIVEDKIAKKVSLPLLICSKIYLTLHESCKVLLEGRSTQVIALLSLWRGKSWSSLTKDGLKSTLLLRRRHLL